LVEKRTLVFLTLTTIVWATLASALAGYSYLQNTASSQQINTLQYSLDKISFSYNEAIGKYDLLIGEYGLLYGNYTYSMNSNFSSLMPLMENLITSFGENYSSLLMQEDINKTYNQIESDYETLLERDNVTKTDFGSLLNRYYGLLLLSALREQQLSVSEAATLTANIEIDYGNGTVEWHNETNISAGSALFELTQELATIKYSFYAFNEPGHVLVDSINNVKTYTDSSYAWGYSWIWYYWSNNGRKWVSGPTGCDAWFIENGGIYKWNYERWSYP
jgi:hypothetical protein